MQVYSFQRRLAILWVDFTRLLAGRGELGASLGSSLHAVSNRPVTARRLWVILDEFM